MNPRAPILYGQPKLHKENNPMRPVVSYVNAPNYRLCKYLNKNLPDKIRFKSKYTIKNTIELTKQLKQIKIPDNAKLVSFDIKSLFTSIPIHELKKIIENHLQCNNIKDKEKDQINEMLNICLTQNYFKFNNKLYKQLEGLPMGSPLSPLLAEIYMDNFEKQLFQMNNPLIQQICYWVRYVDDVFCIWKGSDRQLQEFLKVINNIHPKIQYTMEKEKNHKINFLDITIVKNKNGLTFQIFRKPTFTDNILHAEANQSWKIKMSTFHSYIHRAINIPLDPDDFNNEIKTLKIIAKNNGYNPTIIDNIIKHKRRNNIRKFLYPTIKDNEVSKWHIINYVPPITNKINKILKQLGLKTVAINKTNLGTMLCNNKDKIDKLEKSGVYKLKCNDCEAIYIGQSGRNIKTRLAEHKRAVQYSIKNTGFAEHCIDNNHFPDIDSCSLLHNVQKSKKLDLLEILEIKKAKKQNLIVTNTQIDFIHTPLIDTVIK